MGCVKVVLIILIIRVSLGKDCLRTLETLKNVPTCPRNEGEWINASKKMNCSEINKMANCENATYHCLVDAVSRTMVEVCTVPRNLNGYCPLFNSEPPFVKNDYKRDCTINETIDAPCPLFYSSTDAYKYQGCYNLSQPETTESTLEPAPSVSSRGTSTVQPSTVSYGKTASHNKEEEKSNNMWMKVTFPVLVVLMICVIYIIIVLCLKKRNGISFKEALCVHRYVFTNNQGDANLAPVADGIDNQQNQGENVPMLQSTEEQQNGELESTPYVCSEPSTNYMGVPVENPLSSTMEMDVSDDGEPTVDFRQGPDQLSEPDGFSPVCVNEPGIKIKKKGGTRVTGGSQMPNQADSEVRERNIENLVKGLDKADKRIFALLKEQYKLKGRVKYLEIKLNCVNPLISEVEIDLCGALSESSNENANKENLNERIDFLECEYSCILKRIEKVEPKIISQEMPSTNHSLEASISGGETASEGACGCDLPSRIEILESALSQIQERLKKLYEEGYGKEGQLKSFLAKLQGLECAMDQLETEYGLPVDRFEVHNVRTMAMADTAEERLNKLFDRLENLDLRILK